MSDVPSVQALSPDDTAAIVELRHRLAAHRRAGLEFAEAWAEATASITWPGHSPSSQAGWRAVLRETAAIWHAAYDRAPHLGIDAVARLEPA